jgi:putative ABC transport system substrate-binding protein
MIAIGLLFLRMLIILQLARQYRLPTLFPSGVSVANEGGLMSYGPVIDELFRRVPYYVDRLLRGAKVNELWVECPTKFELVINLKIAKAIGLTGRDAAIWSLWK